MKFKFDSGYYVYRTTGVPEYVEINNTKDKEKKDKSSVGLF